MTKRVNRDDVDKFHDYSLYIPKRLIYVGSEHYDQDGDESGVDGLMAERLVKNITLLESINSDPITIVMNNLGGDWYHGMAIFDAIKGAKSHITMTIYGYAMSMGSVILQAADERIIAPSARLMIHYGTNGMNVTHSKIFEKWAEENKKINEEMEQIYLDKIMNKIPDFKVKRLKEMLNFDTILTAEEAVKLGLADKILGEDDEEDSEG